MIEVVTGYEGINAATKELTIDDFDYVVTVKESDPMTAGVLSKQAIGQLWLEIQEGAKLFFKAQVEPKPDDIVLARAIHSLPPGPSLVDEVVVRHYSQHLEVWILRSSNPDYEDIHILPDDEQLQILGVCIAAQEDPSGKLLHRDVVRKTDIDTRPPLL